MTGVEIRENFSKKQGRPKVDDGLIEKGQLGPNAHTRRGKVNKFYLVLPSAL